MRKRRKPYRWYHRNGLVRRILRGMTVTAACLAVAGWGLMQLVTEPMPDYSDYIRENQAELSSGIWVSQEEYEEIMAEKAAYMERIAKE